MIALGDLFHDAQAEAFPDAPPVALEVMAFNTGSFEVDLHAAAQAAVTLFSSDSIDRAVVISSTA